MMVSSRSSLFHIMYLVTYISRLSAFRPCLVRQQPRVADRFGRSFIQSSRSQWLSTKSSHIPSSLSSAQSNTGGLRRLPVVKSPTELMNRAKNSVRQVQPDMYVVVSVVSIFVPPMVATHYPLLDHPYN